LPCRGLRQIWAHRHRRARRLLRARRRRRRRRARRAPHHSSGSAQRCDQSTFEIIIFFAKMRFSFATRREQFTLHMRAHRFSQIPFIVTSRSKFTTALTFENFCGVKRTRWLSGAPSTHTHTHTHTHTYTRHARVSYIRLLLLLPSTHTHTHTHTHGTLE